ncbi:MAG: hypothetical protein C0508_25975 [Cyanobacteria bacterium PR.023]|nr:hypothetical protein [Cyanobacteria bacterium PR.023]
MDCGMPLTADGVTCSCQIQGGPGACDGFEKVIGVVVIPTGILGTGDGSGATKVGEAGRAILTPCRGNIPEEASR